MKPTNIRITRNDNIIMFVQCRKRGLSQLKPSIICKYSETFFLRH